MAKKTETAAAETEIKAVAEENAPVEKKTAKKPAAKKTAAAKKPAAEKKAPAAKKTSAASKVVIQFGGGEADTAALVEKAKAVAGVKTAKQVDVYVKPEVNRVYYVINGDIFGDFALFE